MRKGETYDPRESIKKKKAIHDRRMAGESYEDIAASLGISPHTAIMHAGDWRNMLNGEVYGRTSGRTLRIVQELTSTPEPVGNEYGYA